jgi:lipoyl-dependent peroxiredoxin
MAPSSEVEPLLAPELARVAARVRRLREERGQTLDELAAISSLSKAYLSRIESGQRQPSLATMFALARAWELPVGALFDEDHGVELTAIQRHATTEWRGGADGDGHISVETGAVDGPYSQEMRRSGEGIVPEELIGAAEAGCLTMTFVRLLSDAGHPPVHVKTNATVHGQEGPDGFRITRIDVGIKAEVPDLSEAALLEYATRARRTCSVSRALSGVEIAVDASLAD